jgi:hypothetical protein
MNHRGVTGMQLGEGALVAACGLTDQLRKGSAHLINTGRNRSTDR